MHTQTCTCTLSRISSDVGENYENKYLYSLEFFLYVHKRRCEFNTRNSFISFIKCLQLGFVFFVHYISAFLLLLFFQSKYFDFITDRRRRINKKKEKEEKKNNIAHFLLRR